MRTSQESLRPPISTYIWQKLPKVAMMYADNHRIIMFEVLLIQLCLLSSDFLFILVAYAWTEIATNNVRLFTYPSLRSATRLFHPSNRIGKGGFGVVYKVSFEVNNL